MLIDRIRAATSAQGSKIKRTTRRPSKTTVTGNAPLPPPTAASMPSTAVQEELPL
jgi:hypothetical protein